MTTLTLIGGLASTVFAPVTELLLRQHSWRVSFLILAAVLAVITIPAHALARYATLAGIFAAPIAFAAAVVPWAATALAGSLGSCPAMFIVLSVLVGTAAAIGGVRPRDAGGFAHPRPVSASAMASKAPGTSEK